MMTILFIFALLYFVLVLIPSADKKKEQLMIKQNQCPPHKWRWVEVKMEDGTVHHTYLECEHCGPYSKIMGFDE